MTNNEPKVTATSDEMGGISRDFSKTQWGMLGENKEGWKIPAPFEAGQPPLTLDAARARYQTVTGKEAPADKSADYLTAVSDMTEASNPAPAPAPATVDAAPAADTTAATADTADAYKRPKSTDEAKAMYTQTFGTEPADSAKYADMVTAIEQKLGIVAAA